MKKILLIPVILVIMICMACIRLPVSQSILDEKDPFKLYQQAYELTTGLKEQHFKGNFSGKIGSLMFKSGFMVQLDVRNQILDTEIPAVMQMEIYVFNNSEPAETMDVYSRGGYIYLNDHHENTVKWRYSQDHKDLYGIPDPTTVIYKPIAPQAIQKLSSERTRDYAILKYTADPEKMIDQMSGSILELFWSMLTGEMIDNSFTETMLHNIDDMKGTMTVNSEGYIVSTVTSFELNVIEEGMPETHVHVQIELQLEDPGKPVELVFPAEIDDYPEE